MDCVIKVSNIPDGTTKDQLIIHFQKRQNGGDDVKYVIYPTKPNSCTALVCFESNDYNGRFLSIFLYIRPCLTYETLQFRTVNAFSETKVTS